MAAIVSLPRAGLVAGAEREREHDQQNDDDDYDYQCSTHEIHSSVGSSMLYPGATSSINRSMTRGQRPGPPRGGKSVRPEDGNVTSRRGCGSGDRQRGSELAVDAGGAAGHVAPIEAEDVLAGLG